MPQMTDLVINDGTANHTFKPRGLDKNGVATFTESSGVPIGDKRVTVARIRTSTGKEKVTVKVASPVVQDVVVNGVSRPTSVRAAYADLTFSFDETSTTAERSAIVNLVYAFLDSQTGIATAVNLDYLY